MQFQSAFGVMFDSRGHGNKEQAGQVMAERQGAFDVDRKVVCRNLRYMKTATVRDLRNRYTSLLRWIAAGEEVLITQKGAVVARLMPAGPAGAQKVNWSDSPEVRRSRSKETKLTAKESAALIAEAGGKW